MAKTFNTLRAKIREKGKLTPKKAWIKINNKWYYNPYFKNPGNKIMPKPN